MRKRKIVVLSILGFGIGMYGAAYYSQSSAASRLPASILSDRSSSWIPTPMGKHLALFQVELASTPIPDNNSEEVEIKGRILVNQEMQGDLSYVWDIPEGVELVEGQLTDAFAQVQKGQIVEVRIVVTGFSKESQKLIGLQATGKKGSETLGGSALLASRPEDTWEAVAPEMKKAAEEQFGLGSGSKSRRGR